MSNDEKMHDPQIRINEYHGEDKLSEKIHRLFWCFDGTVRSNPPTDQDIANALSAVKAAEIFENRIAELEAEQVDIALGAFCKAIEIADDSKGTLDFKRKIQLVMREIESGRGKT